MAVTSGSITLLTDKGQEKPVNNILHYYQKNKEWFMPLPWQHLHILCWTFFKSSSWPTGANFHCSLRSCLQPVLPKCFMNKCRQHNLCCVKLCEIFQKTLTYSVMAKIRRMGTWVARAGLLIFLLRHSWEVVVNITSRCFCRLEWTLLPSVPHSILVLHRITLLGK